MTLKTNKINIITNLHYSRLLLFIAAGHGSIDKIKHIRKNLEGDTYRIPPAVLSNQLKALSCGVLLKDDDNSPLIKIIQPDAKKRQFNRKRWCLIDGSMAHLFLKYVKDRYSSIQKIEKSSKEPSFNDFVARKTKESGEYWLTSAHQKFRASINDLDKHKDIFANLLDELLNGTKKQELFSFIDQQLLKYLKIGFETQIYEFTDRILGQHFEDMINQFIRAFEINSSNVLHNSSMSFDLSKQKERDLYDFIQLMKYLNEPSLAGSLNLLTDIYVYLEKEI
jgi:hypothetical protein